MLSFIVQARVGSSRLPNKILLPFYNGKSIFEMLLEKLKSFSDEVECVDNAPQNNEPPADDFTNIPDEIEEELPWS